MSDVSQALGEAMLDALTAYGKAVTDIVAPGIASAEREYCIEIVEEFRAQLIEMPDGPPTAVEALGMLLGMLRDEDGGP